MNIKRCLPFFLIPILAGCGQDDGQLYDSSLKSMVRLTILDHGEEGHASGVIVGDGLILTAHHVVAGCANHVSGPLPLPRDGAVVNAAEDYRPADALAAAVIPTDVGRDLALLRFAGKRGRPMALAAKSPAPGDAVFTVGGDEQVAFRFASGHVRSVGLATAVFPGHDVQARIISNTVPLNLGDSGGALIGKDGRLLGINSFIETDKQAVNNCIDITEIKTFLAEVKR